MRHTTRHFKQTREPTSRGVDIKREVEEATRKDDVRTLLPLNPLHLQIISRQLPLVQNAEDLDTLAERLFRLSHNGEVGFSPLFCPALVDSTCQRGIFPLAISIAANLYVFAPKLHRQRSLTRLQPSVRGFPVSSDEDEGIFAVENLHVSKKYLSERNESMRTRSFDVFINREEDIAPALSLIWSQHGEDWLCRALRACFVHMFFNKDRYRTKIVVVAVRRHCYSAGTNEKAANEDKQVGAFADGDPVEEGDLVAAEVGFIVGDIYSSATGAYSSSGAGTLQLAVTGEAMRSAGCRVWDLGMEMEYKSAALKCVPLERKRWLKFVREHAADPLVAEGIEKQLLERFRDGVPVRQLLV